MQFGYLYFLGSTKYVIKKQKGGKPHLITLNQTGPSAKFSVLPRPITTSIQIQKLATSIIATTRRTIFIISSSGFLFCEIDNQTKEMITSNELNSREISLCMKMIF